MQLGTESPVRFEKFNHFVYSLLAQAKLRRFKAGFIKLNGSYRTGKFDLQERIRWEQPDGTMYKRKGKKRTTSAEHYLLAFEPSIKRPTNISLDRLLWLSMGKKLYKISGLINNDSLRVVMFEKVKFSYVKALSKLKKISMDKRGKPIYEIPPVLTGINRH